MKMKALSIRQPWAHLILHHGKTIENRSWDTRFRGPFLLHAAKGMTRDEYLDARAFALEVTGHTAHLPAFAEMRRGGIVGAACLTEVVPPQRRTNSWHVPGAYGFAFGWITELPFRPLKGALGFFDVELTADEERVLRREGLI